MEKYENIKVANFSQILPKILSQLGQKFLNIASWLMPHHIYMPNNNFKVFFGENLCMTAKFGSRTTAN